MARLPPCLSYLHVLDPYLTRNPILIIGEYALGVSPGGAWSEDAVAAVATVDAVAAVAAEAGIAGDFGAMQWLLESQFEPALDIQSLFANLCKSGHLSAAQMLVTIRSQLPDDARVDACRALRLACMNGRLSVTQWLFDKFNLTVDSISAAFIGHTFHHTCANGHLEEAQWFLAKFRAPTIRDNITYTFQGVCANGHLVVARWLVTTFHLTAADARAHANNALRGACGHGHLEVAQWLATEFELTANDVFASDALGAACENGHFAVAQWLISKFELTLGDLNVLCGASETGRHHIRQWLVHHIQYTNGGFAYV